MGCAADAAAAVTKCAHTSAKVALRKSRSVRIVNDVMGAPVLRIVTEFHKNEMDRSKEAFIPNQNLLRRCAK